MVGFPFRRRHQTSVTAVSEEVERQVLQRNSSVHKTKHGKSGRGIWSLAIELLAAVANQISPTACRNPGAPPSSCRLTTRQMDQHP